MDKHTEMVMEMTIDKINEDAVKLQSLIKSKKQKKIFNRIMGNVNFLLTGGEGEKAN